MGAIAQENHFNPRALHIPGNPQAIADLSIFEQAGQLPGQYRVDIFLNNRFIETRDVTFIQQGTQLAPVLSAKYWRDLGIKTDASAALAALPDEASVSAVGDYLDAATAQFNFSKMRLNLSIPQAALQFHAHDYINPNRWDQGLAAFLLNYDLDYRNRWQKPRDEEDSSLFLRLDSGINLGAWRLRHHATFTHDRASPHENEGNLQQTVSQTRWQSLHIYAQRDIHRLGAQLTLGQFYTPGDLFSSIRFSGVQLTSDDAQLPDSLRGFAPVIRGIAHTNAQIIVRQNGAVIYQTSVAPGAFAIQDLYPTASSGTLDVTVRQADGSETHFMQPFSAVPGMQRSGRLRYTVTVGKYRASRNTDREPNFLQGTLQYGLNNFTTVYGGVIGSGDYQSALLGLGVGLGNWGSLSFDITHADMRFHGGADDSGQSYRMQYAKEILPSGTSFMLAGYRYSTTGFYDFSEANQTRLHDASDDGRHPHHKRSSLQVQVTQHLGKYGAFYLAAYQQDYWRQASKERTFTMGYNVSHGGVSYSLNLSDTRYPGRRPNRGLYLGVSLPLGRWVPGSNARYSFSTDNDNRTHHQVGMNGLAWANRLSYDINQDFAHKGGGSNGNVNAHYRGTYGNVNAGYSYSRHSHQINGGLSGGLVMHPYGITLSQPLGDTLALVRVPGASGVSVKNQWGVRTDGWGYAVVPYVTAYQRNPISLGTETLPEEVDLQHAVQNVIPTRGALVLADFKANVGARVLANVQYQGKPIPFGATATLLVNGKAISHSFVGNSGDLYLSGVPEQSQVQIQWGQGRDQQCVGEVRLSPPSAHRFRSASIDCY